MSVGDIIKIKKTYDKGIADVQIIEIQTPNKILCEYIGIHCKVMISPCDIIDSNWYKNQKEIIKAVHKQKREYYCTGNTTMLRENCGCSYGIIMV